MLFNSTRFIIFFPIVVGLYFFLPFRLRWLFLLAASYYFYTCWRVEYVALLIASTLVDYFAGLMMGRTDEKAARRKYLILSICTNLALLFSFKYYNFFRESIEIALGALNIGYTLPVSHFLLPIGISFYSFQSMSYTIEVYRGNQKPQRHLGIFALYVAFFPQLVAGPIERAHNLLPQLLLKHRFDYERVANGLKLMTWGFFKKVVIADRLAQLVDPVYADPTQHQGIPLAIATVFFAFQIFCDFSGYTDIAIGAGQVLGIKLMNNFKRPYFATSVTEFWRRWHISLSTWFRDYVYIPLGGNRVAVPRWYANIFIVFLLSGLWHGANWTFLVWGALHATYMVLGRILRPAREKGAALVRLDKVPHLGHGIRIATTFLLVTFAWIFFRANSMSDALYIVRTLPTGWHIVWDLQQLEATIFSLGLIKRDFLLVVALIVAMECVHALQARGSVIGFLAQRPVWIRWSVYSALVWCIFLFGIFTHKEFIYFTF